MEILKNEGPKTETCDIPNNIFSQGLLEELILVLNFCSLKKLSRGLENL